MAATFRATFEPHERSAPIPRVDARADSDGALRLVLLDHVLDSLGDVIGSYAVSVNPDLSGGVVWAGEYCTDPGWVFTLEPAP